MKNRGWRFEAFSSDHLYDAGMAAGAGNGRGAMKVSTVNRIIRAASPFIYAWVWLTSPTVWRLRGRIALVRLDALRWTLYNAWLRLKIHYYSWRLGE